MSAPLRTRAALITLAPVRRATSAQKTGPSSPCSWISVSPAASAVSATSGRVGFTNTPATSTRRLSVAPISAATSSLQRRGECDQKIRPTAQAPSVAACWASCTVVMPQNLILGAAGAIHHIVRAPGSRLLRRRLGGPVPERDREPLGLRAAVSGQRQRVTRCLGGDDSLQVIHARDPVAVGERDPVAGPQSGSVRRTALLGPGDPHAGALAAHRDARDAEVGELDLTAALEPQQHVLGGVDRHREPDPD